MLVPSLQRYQACPLSKPGIDVGTLDFLSRSVRYQSISHRTDRTVTFGFQLNFAAPVADRWRPAQLSAALRRSYNAATRERYRGYREAIRESRIVTTSANEPHRLRRGQRPRLQDLKQARVIGGCRTGFKTSNRHVAIRDPRIAIRQKIRMSAR